MIIDFESSITEGNIPYKLPKNWTWYNWKDIMKSYQQGLIRSNSQVGQGNVKYLKMGDISSSGMADLSNLKLTNANKKEIQFYKLSDGDFLINVRNSMSLVGKTCVITSTSDSTILFNHMLVRIDNGSPELNYYVNAYLNIPTSKKLLDRLKEGTTTVIALYQRELKNLPIAIPDEITFRTIVSFYRTILNKIELNNKINAELELMAKLIYDYWFVQFDFPDENGKPYKSAGGKMVYNEELKREIPEGWEIGFLSSYIAKDKSGDWGKEFEQGNYTLNVKCIRGADINGIKGQGELKCPDRYILPKNSHKIIESGDIVVEISGGSPTQSTARAAYINDGVLKRFDVPLISSNFCRVITLNQPKWIYSFFQEWHLLYDADFFFGWEGKTSGIKNFLFEQFLENYKTVLPPEVLLNMFNETVCDYYNKVQMNLLESQKLAELRDWLLPMLMNGQITIKD